MLTHSKYWIDPINYVTYIDKNHRINWFSGLNINNIRMDGHSLFMTFLLAIHLIVMYCNLKMCHIMKNSIFLNWTTPIGRREFNQDTLENLVHPYGAVIHFYFLYAFSFTFCQLTYFLVISFEKYFNKKYLCVCVLAAEILMFSSNVYKI